MGSQACGGSWLGRSGRCAARLRGGGRELGLTCGMGQRKEGASYVAAAPSWASGVSGPAGGRPRPSSELGWMKREKENGFFLFGLKNLGRNSKGFEMDSKRKFERNSMRGGEGIFLQSLLGQR